MLGACRLSGSLLSVDVDGEAVVVEREREPARQRDRFDLRQRAESLHAVLEESSAARGVVAVISSASDRYAVRSPS